MSSDHANEWACERETAKRGCMGIRLIGAGLVLLLGVSLRSSAQEPEPPIRLKKKEPEKKLEEKKAEEKKLEEKDLIPKEGKEPKDEPAPLPEEDAKQIVERIAKNMKASADRLKDKDPGDGTQQIQRDIVNDLDKLIEHAKQQDQQQQQQAGGMGGGQGKAGSRRSQQRQAKGQGGGQQNQPQAKSGSGQGSGQSQAKGQGQGNQGGAGSTSPNDPNKVADLHKDIWGHLPETLRMQMDAYARESFMLNYQDLLRQYYATIAEKGRKSGEGER